MASTIHIHPTAELAERVLLPGDPGRALRLAQLLIDGPRMFNHNRGLWGYSGPARADGAALTIQSTGMGGPSAAIVVHELIALGARRLLRIGTCGGLDPQLALGQLLVASEVIADDGTSRALGARERIDPDPALLMSLQAATCRSLGEPGSPAAGSSLGEPGSPASGRPLGDAGSRAAGTPDGGAEPQASTTATAIGPIVSTDLFYDAEDRHAGWIARGARAVEMEAATLLTLAARHGVQAAALLIVSDRLGAVAERISEAALAQAEADLGQLAVSALGAQAAQHSQPT